ncbi:uncharacterized protein EDB91DRAFT_1062483, partial [Suillus paluster]|uniref:uncharacterized protein n=1 Tax=Suillus paluster TaxID=48578 RepID=UPI001B86E7B7
IHAHERYNDVVQLYDALKHSLPVPSTPFHPSLQKVTLLARPALLDRRQRQLQYWLGAVLLHPEIGACRTVR